MVNKKQQFGIWMLIALIIGNTIGAGIFMLPVSLAKIGSISIFSWLFTSAGALLFALVFSKMSKLVGAKSGGPYAYTRACFGDFIGFQIGFTFWIASWTGNCSLVVTLMSYLHLLFPSLTNSVVASGVGIAIIWVIATINIIGIRPVGIVQIITTIIKLLPILLVIIIGAMYFHPQNITQHFNISGKSNFGAFSYAAMLTLWAFSGQETACIPAGAAENPERNIQLATIIGTVVLIIVYIFATLAIMGLFPAEILAHSSSPFADAIGMIFGRWGHLFVVICVVISCLGALNSGILVEGQIPMAIAEDGLFPKIFAKRNRGNSPGWGIAIDATLMSCFILLTNRANLAEQFQLVITIASVATLIAYLYSALAEIILITKMRRTGTKQAYNKTNIVIALFAAIYAFWAIFGSGMEIIFYMTMMLFASAILYTYFHWRKVNSTLDMI